MIFAWSAHERDKPDAPALLIVLATFIKLFGIFALLPCLLRERRRNLLVFTTAWAAVFALAPLFVVTFNELGLLYRNWYATLQAFNQARLGISVMGFLKSWLHLTPALELRSSRRRRHPNRNVPAKSPLPHLGNGLSP